MSTRITAQELKHLLPELDIEVTDTQFFIQQATLIVDEDLAGQGISDARLKQIELMLAAHYTIIAVERGGLVETETLNARDKYAVNSDKEGLASTRWGAQAVVLDSSGVLASATSIQKTAQFRIA